MSTPINQDVIQQLYVAFFNRPADPAGLAYWVSQLPSNKAATTDQIHAIANYFNSSLEYSDLYTGQSNSQIISTLYINLFGRAAGTQENSYWTNLLNQKLESFASIALDVASGAQGTDATAIAAKVGAADAFTSSIVTNSQLTGYSGNTANVFARAWLSHVVDAASEAIQVSANVMNPALSNATLGGTATNSTFTLTSAIPALQTIVTATGLPPAHPTVTMQPGTEQVSVPAGQQAGQPVGTPVLTWTTAIGSNGIPVSQLDTFLQTITGLTLAQLGIITAGPAATPATQPVSITIGNINTGAATAGGDNSIKITLGSGEVISPVVALAKDYMGFLNSLLFNEDGSSRLSMVTEVSNSSTPVQPIVLTPSINTGSADNGRGAFEAGVTTVGNDTIVVGRPELLMGAYIDGGLGYNTLQIEMKGVFAQPLALLNIQEVDVENMPHLYTNIDSSTCYPAITRNGLGGASYLDLSSAANLQKLVITEGQPFVNQTGGTIGIGALNVIGIKGSSVANGVTIPTHVLLEGGFTQPVNLSYGLAQNGAVNLDLQLGYTQPTFSINIANSASVLNIDSMGYANTFSALTVGSTNGDFAGTLSKIVVSGTGILEIDDSLWNDFNYASANKPNIIDATTNTGGVILNNDSPSLDGPAVEGYVKFLGSQAADSFSAKNNKAVTIIAQSSNNADNIFTTDNSTTVKITALGSGNDTISAVNGANIKIQAGDGNNTIIADSNIAGGITKQVIVINAGNGDNAISANNTGTIINQAVTVTTGTGSDTISALHNDSVTINAGSSTGNNTVKVSANHIAITTGSGDDVITVFGETPASHFFSNGTNNQVALESTLTTPGCLGSLTGASGAVLNIISGGGSDTVVLGDANNQLGFVALTGSVISGTDIALQVNESSDLSQATLTGISSVILNNSSANHLSNLTLSAAQFEAIGSANISVHNAAFGAIANVDIIITSNTDISDLNLSTLSANVRLNFNILNGAVLTLTAEQLTKYVAVGGVVSTDGLNGSVVINNAGTTFDPFATGANNNVIAGGSLTSTFDISKDVTINRVADNLGGYERPAPTDNSDILTINSTSTDETDTVAYNVTKSIDARANGHVMTLDIIGNQNVVFDAGVTVKLPAGSTIDLHSLVGTVTGLKMANVSGVVHVIGNDTAANSNNTIVDLILTGNVTVLNTSGVSEYLVTSMTGDYSIDLTNEKDVHVLGLQGNQGHTLTLNNVTWGASAPTFLLQGDGVANANQATITNGANPNVSTVGAIDIEFNEVQGPGAPAVVNINNGGVALGTTMSGGVRALEIDGITVHNAGSLTINVTDGNAIIDLIIDNKEALTTLDFTASGSLSVGGELPLSLTTIDASAVTGLFTATIGDDESALSFIGGAGGVNLTLNGFDALAGTTIDLGAGATQLIIHAITDLNHATLTNVNAVVLDNDSALTLNFVEFNAISAAHITVNGVGSTATLNLLGLDGQPFAKADLAPGINLGTVTLAHIPVVTLDATTDLTGIHSLVVDAGTVLNLTAHQFMALTNQTITGAGTVNITGLTQADIDAGLDLSGITTAGSVTLDLAATQVNLKDAHGIATDLGTFTHFVLAANQTLGVATQHQAVSGLTVDDGAGGIATGSILEMLFGSLTSPFINIDASHFKVTTLQVLNTLFANPLNAESAFKGLPSETQLEIISSLLNVTSINRQVLVDAGVTVEAATVFNSIQTNTEINSLTLTLAGGVDLNGNLRLSYTNTAGSASPLLSQLLNIVSNGSDTTVNHDSGIAANIINGSITPLNTNRLALDNNLLTVHIDATQDLKVNGGIVFNSVATQVAATHSATAHLVVNSTANVTLGTLDTSTAHNVTTLDIANNGTGNLSVTLDGAKMYSSNGVSEVVNFSGDHIDLIIQNEVNLTADDLAGVTQLTIDGSVATDAAVTLTADQLNTIGNANIFSNGVDPEDSTLNIVNLGSVAFDATTLPTNIQVGYVEIKAGNITLDPTTNLTGVSEIIVHAGSTLNMTALQLIQLQSHDGHIVGIAADGSVNAYNGDVTNYSTHYVVNITDFGNATLTDTQLKLEQNIDLGSNVVSATGLVDGNGLAGTISLATGAEFALSSSAMLGGVLTQDGYVGGFAIQLGDNDHLTLASVEQASGRTITGTDLSTVSLALNYHGTGVEVGTTALSSGFASVGETPTGVDASVKFVAVSGGHDVKYYVGLEASAYTGGFTLQVLHTLVEGTNVEQVLAHLSSGITVNVVTAAEIPTAPADLTNRVVIVDPNTTIDTNQANDSLVFANLTGTGLVHKLSLDLKGGDNVLGNIDISTIEPLTNGYTKSYFDKLSIISEGHTVNNLGVDNTDPLLPVYSVIEATGGNNLLKVDITATEALNVGIIDLTSMNKNATATVTVNGSANVNIAELSTKNLDAAGTVTTISIVDNLTDGAVLTIPGDTPAINDNDANTLSTLELSGTGNLVIGSEPVAVTVSGNSVSLINSQPAIDASAITLIDASALSGDLTINDIAGVNESNFTFTSGTGLTTVSLGDYNIKFGEPLKLAAVVSDTGWVFDLTNAAAGSTLTIDTDVTTFTSGHFEVDLGKNGNTVVLNGWNYNSIDNNWDNLQLGGLSAFDIKGTDGTLDINGDVDFTSLDTVTKGVETNKLDLSGVKSIVLSEGSSVQMTDAEYKAFTDAGGTITGPGTTLLVDVNGPQSFDFTQFRGITAVHLDQASYSLGLIFTAQQALVTTLYNDVATPGTYVVSTHPVGVPAVDTAYTAGDFTGLPQYHLDFPYTLNDLLIKVTDAASSDISALQLDQRYTAVDVQAGVIIPTLTINEVEAFALLYGYTNATEDLTNVSTVVIKTYTDSLDPLTPNAKITLPITADIAHNKDGSFLSAAVTANAHAMSIYNADITKATLVQHDVVQYLNLTEVTQTGLGGSIAALDTVVNTVDVVDHYQFYGLGSGANQVTKFSAATIDSFDTTLAPFGSTGPAGSTVDDTFDFTEFLGGTTTHFSKGATGSLDSVTSAYATGGTGGVDVTGDVLFLNTAGPGYATPGEILDEVGVGNSFNFASNTGNAIIIENSKDTDSHDSHIWAIHDVNSVITVSLIGIVTGGAAQIHLSAANFI